ncbi:MAG TPA: YciI family protein [Vicinamibacteria bacterium]|nr:YciI family protein [Vicinamibacteria bacterium]
MSQYMLAIYQPDGEPPPPSFLESVARDLHALNEEIKAAGGWVFSRALHAPSTATVVRLRDRQVVTTDGPYVESKEHIGGFWIVEAPDLDVALAWAAKAARATTLPIEVRPFQDVPEH